MKPFTRYPTKLIYNPDPITICEVELFGEIKLSWGMEFYIFRVSITREGPTGIGEIRLLPKEEFHQFFAHFKELPQSDLH